MIWPPLYHIISCSSCYDISILKFSILSLGRVEPPPVSPRSGQNSTESQLDQQVTFHRQAANLLEEIDADDEIGEGS